MYSTSDPAIIGYGSLDFQNSPQSVDVEELKDQILAAINSKRPYDQNLIQNDDLEALAVQRVEELVNNSLNQNYWECIDEGQWTYRGGNYANGSKDRLASDIVAAWEGVQVTSPRESIFSANCTHYGIAIRENETNFCVVILVAGQPNPG